MEEETNYSIIIPHKNIPALLQRCLNSIPRREDIQIIVVDDNSDSNIVDFDHFPGMGESCVEVVFTKEGKGAGYARNVGLSKAKGKWLLFADADDFFHKNAFDVFETFYHSRSDIIYLRVDSIYSDTLEKAKREKYLMALMDYYFKTGDDSRLRYRYIVPWGKMLRKSFVEKYNLYFDEVFVSNDTMFNIKVGFYANEITVSNELIYCVTISHGSLVNRINYETLLCRYMISLNVNYFLKEKNKEEYQMPLIFPLLKSIKYGIVSFMKFLQLAKKMNINPLVGIFSPMNISTWWFVLISFSNKNKEYKTN